MAALNFNQAVLSALVRLPDMPRDHPTPYPVTTRIMYLTCSSDPAFGGAAALSVDGGTSAWLTIPATCEDSTPFSVTVDGWSMEPGDYTATIRATKATYTDAVCVLTVAVRPLGHPRLSGRRR